jgi:hypothetical protein
MDDEDFHEHFLQANAHPDFIASQFADVIRDLMRAVSADGDVGPVYEASEKMKLTIELLRRCPEPPSWHRLFHEAVSEIQSVIANNADPRDYIRAAKRGTKYLAETSATDSGARGRSGRRLNEFKEAFRWSDASRNGQ